MQLRNTNHAHHVEKHVYNYVLINSFDYNIVQINVFDLKLSFCIDFDEIVNLLNKSVLFRNNLYNIIHNAFSIIIIDVIERQVINQVIKFDVELSFNKISLKMTTYLMKNLFSELIIVNDVLNRLDVNFQHDNNIIKIEIQKMILFYNNVDSTSYYYTIASMRFDQHINKIIMKWKSNIINKINLFKIDIFINYFNSTSIEFVSMNQYSFSSQYQFKCRRCKQIFDFNNQLYNHLIECRTREIKCIRRRNFIDSWKF